LIGQTLIIELKNDLTIEGTLYSVDQFLNLKLKDIKVRDEEKYPHMVSSFIQNTYLYSPLTFKLSVKNCFIRGSVIRYVHIPKEHVDVDLLQDATRAESKQSKEGVTSHQ
jgi:small nuclear ribonucleoprotein (snRNP)-like protein